MKIRRVKPSPILQKKLRVAALHHSLAVQISYYSSLIQKGIRRCLCGRGDQRHQHKEARRLKEKGIAVRF